MRRVGIYGWGVVAPRSPDVEAFERNLERPESWLEPYDGFGPNNFMVGVPDFRFSDYKGWIDERFPPNRYHQLEKRMGEPTLFAIGAFIQSLRQNPGIEAVLTELGSEAHVYVGTGLGDLPTIGQSSLDYHRAQRRWDRFWANPERNEALAAWLAKPESEQLEDADAPPRPESALDEDRDEAEERFWRYWASRSSGLQEYLAELREIESLSIEGEVDVEAAKLGVLREKRARTTKLKKKWNAPDAPWQLVPASLLFNIHNTPASQISMMGKITGMTYAPVAACASFGYALHLAAQAIDTGQAKAVVIGMSDPAPLPMLVGSFYDARVISADGDVSKPLTGMRGTHVGGGAVVWIVGDHEYMSAKGFKPLGMEPIGLGVSADAQHIITPSKEGPLVAIRQALDQAGVEPSEIRSWDLHATATPGDFLEVANMRKLIPEDVLVTARKGTFGHGMSAGGGWELMAQYMGYARGQHFPTPLRKEELNPSIAQVHQRFVFDEPVPAEGLAGKLSMGIGGINACVISRPWDD